MADRAPSAASRCVLATAEDTRQAGRRLAEAIPGELASGLIVHLIGELGAGKTTFVRGMLEALGHSGLVPSPTYTLIEPYELRGLLAYHVDLYRLSAGPDVDELGLGELLCRDSLLMVEWPDRAADRLPAPDLTVTLKYADSGRLMTLQPGSAAGERLLAHKI